MLGYCHTMISLICMSIHKAMAARCLSHHLVTSGQHAIRALAAAPLRRLALSVLFTIATTSYQTTLYSLREIFNKRQHANATYRVEFSHYDKYYELLKSMVNDFNELILFEVSADFHQDRYYFKKVNLIIEMLKTKVSSSEH